MSGTVRELGEVTLGDVLPGLAVARAALQLTGGIALAEVQAKLAGLINVQAALTLPPLPGAAIIGAAQVLLALEANIGLAAPTLQLAGTVALVAQLNLLLGQIRAQLALDFGLNIGGIAAYSYEGTADALGSSLASVTSAGLPGGGPSDQCYAVVLAASTPTARAAIRAALF